MTSIAVEFWSLRNNKHHTIHSNIKPWATRMNGYETGREFLVL
jgi:hypothetical protein